MDQRALLEEFLKKNKRAVRNIKAYTWCVQALMVIYGLAFFYYLAVAGDTVRTLISFILNFLIILRIGTACSSCRFGLNPPQNSSKARAAYKVTLFLEIVYFCLYVAAAGILYFLSEGRSFHFSIFLVLFSTPSWLMALIGLCVMRNFKTLSRPFQVYRGKDGSQEKGEGKEAAEQPTLGAGKGNIVNYSLSIEQSSTAAYSMAPEDLSQENQGMTKNEGGVVDPC